MGDPIGLRWLIGGIQEILVFSSLGLAKADLETPSIIRINAVSSFRPFPFEFMRRVDDSSLIFVRYFIVLTNIIDDSIFNLKEPRIKLKNRFDSYFSFYAVHV